MIDGLEIGDVINYAQESYLVLNVTPENVMTLDVDKLKVYWVTVLGTGCITKLKHNDSLIQTIVSRIVANKFATMTTDDRLALLRFLTLDLML